MIHLLAFLVLCAVALVGGLLGAALVLIGPVFWWLGEMAAGSALGWAALGLLVITGLACAVLAGHAMLFGGVTATSGERPERGGAGMPVIGRPWRGRVGPRP